MKKVLLLVSIFQAIVLFSYSQENPIPYGNNPAVGKYYNIRGIKMYCEVYGTGEPLLFLHGNGGSIANFSKNIPYFSKKYMVIAVDSRAQGKSTDPSDSLSFEMMADDFDVLLDTLHIKQTYVIGWSDGGINALLLAMRHPDKVIKLASTGANLSPDTSAQSPKLWKGMQKYYNASKDKPRTTPQQKNSWKIFLLDWLQPNIPVSALKAIQCPSLIICGDHDLIPVEHTVLIYKNIANAYLWVVPNSGHGTLIEHKDDFNTIVDKFFTDKFKARQPGF